MFSTPTVPVAGRECERVRGAALTGPTLMLVVAVRRVVIAMD
jgi:hypothetical protein